MSVIDFFKGMAADAEQRVGQLAARGEANLGRRRALDALDGRLDQLVADGKLDPAERSEIRARLAEAGADPAQVESLFRELDTMAGDGDGLRSRLGQAIRTQRAVAEDDQAEQSLALQFAMQDYDNGLTAASSLLKNEHDTYLAVIRNIA